jgi:hypothetical protein
MAVSGGDLDLCDVDGDDDHYKGSLVQCITYIFESFCDRRLVCMI